MKSCPFCGAASEYSINDPKLLGCPTPQCVLRGLLMTPERWNIQKGVFNRISSLKALLRDCYQHLDLCPDAVNSPLIGQIEMALALNIGE